MSPIHTYGEQGLAYPVEPGQVWAVGDHVYSCSDLMATTLFDKVLEWALSREDWPDQVIVYTDPPWGQGLANGFRTRAGLGRAEYDWTEIYRRCADIAEEFRAPFYAECSKADSPIGMRVPGVIGRRHGPTVRRYWDIGYFGGNPSGLYYAHSEPPPDFELTNPEGWAVVATVLRSYGSSVVIDPCSGLGGIPLEAQRAGHSSVNNELAPHRVSKAMSRMSKVTGLEPRKVEL